MAHYIDADRLRAEIEKVYKSEIAPWLSGVSATSAIYDYVLPLIDSLKQEQPEVDLEKELEDYARENPMEDSGSYLNLMNIARHFYELGCRRTAEKYDEIEYNRQMAEEHLADARKTSPKDLEEAAGEYEKKHTYQRYDGGGLTPEYDATLAEAVIFGAKWQKEQDEKGLSEKIAAAYQLGLADKEKQMMKEAVCYIAQPDITATGNILIPFIRIGYTALSRYGIKVGDKVRIIIVKEDSHE